MGPPDEVVPTEFKDAARFGMRMLAMALPAALLVFAAFLMIPTPAEIDAPPLEQHPLPPAPAEKPLPEPPEEAPVEEPEPQEPGRLLIKVKPGAYVTVGEHTSVKVGQKPKVLALPPGKYKVTLRCDGDPICRRFRYRSEVQYVRIKPDTNELLVIDFFELADIYGKKDNRNRKPPPGWDTPD